MSRDKEVGEAVSAIIYLANNQYSCLVELLGVSTVNCSKEVGKKEGWSCLWAQTPKRKMGRREKDAHQLVSG